MRSIIFVVVSMVALAAVPSVQANEQSCAMDVGIPFVAFNGPVTLGGCLIGTTGSASVVGAAFVSNDEFCSIQADTDGDLQSETDVVVGTELPAGSQVWMFCTIGFDEVGTVDLESGTWA